MGASTNSFLLGAQQGLRTYYFRKLARYLIPVEYQRVKQVREQTDAQVTIPEMLFLRWGLRQRRPETVVEIGSFAGASTSLIADVLQELGGGHIYAIDLFSKAPIASGHTADYWKGFSASPRGPEYWKTFDRAMAPYTGWCDKIEGDSRDIPWNQPIDFLFIDGDHSEEGASADIAKYVPFVRPGGYIFLHDYLNVPEHNSMVKNAVDRLLLSDRTYSVLGVVTSLIGFRKSVN